MKEKILKLRAFINSQKLYIWLIIFILVVNAAAMLLDVSGRTSSDKGPYLLPTAEELAEKVPSLEAKLMENQPLAVLSMLAILLVVLVIFVGVVLNVVILNLKFRKIPIISRSLDPPSVNWEMWDVAKVIILFIFFGYMLELIELALVPVFPILKTQDNLRLVINSTLLDILGLGFVFYFAVVKYRHKLVDLGLSCKNFFKNTLYGITGYVATVPVLLLIMLAIVWVSTVFNYQPPAQQVLEVFVEEKEPPILIYMSIFVAILGPCVEEIFFRGYMYNAIRKRMGMFWAVGASSVLFAFLHAHLVGFLPILVLGLLLSYLYEKTGTLVAPITVHIIHNSAMVFFVFLMKRLYF